MRYQEYSVRIALNWLNERYRTDFELSASDGVWRASDAGAGDLTVIAADLFEISDEYRQRCAELEQRLDDSRPGSYLLWVPPGGEIPAEEPDESEWVRRVVLGASRLASGRSGEVRLPVRMALGKVKDEGGYASVTGGLARYWTDISSRLHGSFFLDSRGLRRLTKNTEEREQLYEHVALLSQGLSTGEVAEFDHEDAWPVQRLPRSEGLTDGWAISGCPPGFDPADGGAIRRILRRRLTEARELLTGKARPWFLVLTGAYEYIDYENAGPSLRGFDPSLTAALDGIILVSDAEVKPILLNRNLSFVKVAGA